MFLRGLLRTFVLALLAALLLGGCSSNDDPARPRTGRLAGQVQDEFRDALPHATVHAWALASGSAVPSDSTSVAVMTRESDATGAFDFGELPAGEWVVTAGYAATLAAADTVTLPAASLVLRADAGASVAGQVQLGSLPGAGGVRILSALPTPSVLSAPDGHWTLAGLPPGRWPLKLTMDGFRDSVVSVGPLAAGQTLTLPPVQLQPLAP